MTSARWLIAALAILATAACSGEKTTGDKREAGGEVLPGSISDAMLPVDTVRSQPPLAPHSAAPKDDAGSSTSTPSSEPSATADSPAAADAAPAAPMPDAT